jgi:hypothetical protein
LDIRKIKNTIIWDLLFLQEFILITGRTISIEDPVVPIIEERNVPNIKSITLTLGEPARSPSNEILPDTQYSPNRSTMNVK